MNLNLVYKGNTLNEEITKRLIDGGRNKLNLPPSFLITVLSYEGFWGSSNVARTNNNWGGMTWGTGWTNPQKRFSGVTVYRGSARPKNEGGHYIGYYTVDDFMVDWIHYFRRGHFYKVADSKTFDDAVKGMFKYGGALHDYAEMGGGTSKSKYEKYLAGMRARRKAINEANDGALDKIDNKEDGEPTIPLPEDTWDKDTIVDNIKDKYDKLKKELEEGIENLSKAVDSIFSSDIYKYGDSFYTANTLIKIQYISHGVYKIKPNGLLEDLLKNLNIESNDKVTDTDKELEDITTPKDPQIPPKNEDDTDFRGVQPTFPTVAGMKVTSAYGWRNAPFGGKRSFHTGTDFGHGGAPTRDLYFTQDGEVVANRWNDISGWLVILKHTKVGDKYFSVYQHMREQSNVKVGTKVKAGDKVGNMGKTGRSTGVHLHFEIATSQTGFWKPEGTIDPQKYLKMFF